GADAPARDGVPSLELHVGDASFRLFGFRRAPDGEGEELDKAGGVDVRLEVYGTGALGPAKALDPIATLGIGTGLPGGDQLRALHQDRKTPAEQLQADLGPRYGLALFVDDPARQRRGDAIPDLGLRFRGLALRVRLRCLVRPRLERRGTIVRRPRQ